MNFESIREKIAYQPILLGVFALLASGALAWASSATGDAIAAAEAKDLRDSLAEVLPAGLADNDFLKDTLAIDKAGHPVTIYRARNAGAVKAAVFQVAERGYAGEISILMAVDAEGHTLGVRVLKHAETPGLGDKIEVAKDNWILGFTGKSLTDPSPENWKVQRDGGVFDQFSGATITPRAVVKTIYRGLNFFERHRAALTAPLPAKS